MATLLLPVATYEMVRTRPMSASDWETGSFLRRYRNSREVREWTLKLRGSPGDVRLAAHQFAVGGCGAAEWDWVPPREVAAIKAQFKSHSWTPATAVRAEEHVAVVVECRSSDS